MKIHRFIGALLISVVVLYLFIISLPFIWWFWALLLGLYLIVPTNSNEDKNNPKIKEELLNDHNQYVEDFHEEIFIDHIDEDKKTLMENHNLDENSAGKVQELIDEGLDEEDAVEFADE